MAIDVDRRDDLLNQPVSQKDLRNETKGIREDFMIVFGLFASIIVFLSIDVQVFQKATRFAYVVGLSLFLLGSLQMFVLSLYNIIKQKNAVKDYLENPVVWLTALCFAAAVVCFIIGKY